MSSKKEINKNQEFPKSVIRTKPSLKEALGSIPCQETKLQKPGWETGKKNKQNLNETFMNIQLA